MDVRKRIRLSMMLGKMKENESLSQKLGLEDKSVIKTECETVDLGKEKKSW